MTHIYPPENERMSPERGLFQRELPFSNHQLSGDMLVQVFNPLLDQTCLVMDIELVVHMTQQAESDV